MAIGVSMYKDLLKNKTYDDLVEYLKEQEKYLISDELKKVREEEIKMGVDDNNCISNVENEIIAIKELLQEKTLEKYKKIDNVELQEILNLIESNPRFVDGIRLLSKEEVVNYKTEYNLSIDNIIPLIDLYDNEFVVYNITTNKFNILDISDEFIRESENVKNYIEKLKSNEVDSSKEMLRKDKVDENDLLKKMSLSKIKFNEFTSKPPKYFNLFFPIILVSNSKIYIAEFLQYYNVIPSSDFRPCNKMYLYDIELNGGEIVSYSDINYRFNTKFNEISNILLDNNSNENIDINLLRNKKNLLKQTFIELLNDGRTIDFDKYINNYLNPVIDIVTSTEKQYYEQAKLSQTNIKDITNLNDIQKKYYEKISDLLHLPIINLELNKKRLNEINSVYYYNTSRGGKSIIVSDDGTYLCAGSSVNYDKLYEEFTNGRRNGDFNQNKILKINCHSCGEQIEINCSKFPTNVKTLDTMCSNCKSFIKFGNLNYIDEQKQCEHEWIETDKVPSINKEWIVLDDGTKKEVYYFIYKCSKCNEERRMSEEEFRKTFSDNVNNSLQSKEEQNDEPIKKEEDINKIKSMLKEVESYIWGENKNLEKAKSMLIEFIESSPSYDDESTEYYDFNDVIEFVLYTRINKPTKNIKWISIPYFTVYGYLAYIYNEQSEFDEALKCLDKASKWNPISINPLLEKCEAYKMQKKWEEYKNTTESLYNHIYSAYELARYYRNLGFYYIEHNKFDLAYALYTASLQFEKSNTVYRELEYINQQLHRESYTMSAEEGLKLLRDNNIPYGAKKDNINLLIEIYTNEKELIKNPLIEMQLSKRIYYLTLDKKYSPFYEQYDKTTGCSIIIPRSWKVVEDDIKLEKFGKKCMFAFYTDSNAFLQAVYDGLCSPEEFEQAYRLNVSYIQKDNNSKLISETSLDLNLQQCKKTVRQALFDIETENKKLRILHNFILVNGILVNFTINLDENININDSNKYNNQKNMQDLVNVLLSIIEVDNKNNNTKKPISNTMVSNLVNKIDNQLIELTKQEFEEINIVYKNNKNISRIFDFADNTFKKAKDNDPFWIQSSKEALIYVLVNLIETNNSLRYDDLRNIMNDKSKFVILCKNPETSLENIELNKIIDRLLKANDKMLDDFYSIIMENLNIINPKEETYVCNVKFNNESNFTLIIPRTLGELVRHNDTTFKIGNNLNIMKAKCNNVESLKKRADEWLKNSADTNGQTILENLGKEYFLKNNQLSVIYKVVEKESKKRYYKFVYYNELMLIFGYSNEKIDKVIDDIIESIKAIKEQEKIERNPFEDPNLKSEINSSDLKVDIIKELYNNDTIKLKLFGKEREIQIFSTGDNKFDETGNYKSEDFKLNNEELDVLNWFISNIKIEDYKKEIMDYCNNEYSSWSYADGTQEGPIGIDDVENEVDIRAIAINVTENWKANDGFVYPEISFYGECKCDKEHGICIGFRNKKFLGIHSQDWTL